MNLADKKPHLTILLDGSMFTPDRHVLGNMIGRLADFARQKGMECDVVVPQESIAQHFYCHDMLELAYYEANKTADLNNRATNATKTFADYPELNNFLRAWRRMLRDVEAHNVALYVMPPMPLQVHENKTLFECVDEELIKAITLQDFKNTPFHANFHAKLVRNATQAYLALLNQFLPHHYEQLAPDAQHIAHDHYLYDPAHGTSSHQLQKFSAETAAAIPPICLSEWYRQALRGKLAPDYFKALNDGLPISPGLVAKMPEALGLSQQTLDLIKTASTEAIGDYTLARLEERGGRDYFLMLSDSPDPSLLKVIESEHSDHAWHLNSVELSQMLGQMKAAGKQSANENDEYFFNVMQLLPAKNPTWPRATKGPTDYQVLAGKIQAAGYAHNIASPANAAERSM